jgi:predicted secreted protein
MMVRTALAAALILASQAARANTQWKGEIVGFSPDGKRVAAILHGDGDETGVAWAELHVVPIATPQNAEIERIEKAPLGEADTSDAAQREREAVQRTRERAAVRAKELGFEKWVQGDKPPAGVRVSVEEAGECDSETGQKTSVIHLLSGKRELRRTEHCGYGAEPLELRAHAGAVLALVAVKGPGHEGPSTQIELLSARLPR